MQFEPDAPTLLAAVARLLDERVLAVVPAELAHQVRVAANLCRIVEREVRLDTAGRERQLLTELLGTEVDDPQALVAERLRHDDGDLAFELAAWPVLVEIARMDLAIAKPGHDSWEGG